MMLDNFEKKTFSYISTILYLIVSLLMIFYLSNISIYNQNLINDFFIIVSCFGFICYYLLEFIFSIFKLDFVVNFDFKTVLVLLFSCVFYFLIWSFISKGNSKKAFIIYFSIFLFLFSYTIVVIFQYNDNLQKNSQNFIYGKELLLNQVSSENILYNRNRIQSSSSNLIIAENIPMYGLSVFYDILYQEYNNWNLNSLERYYRAYYWYKKSEPYIDKGTDNTFISRYCDYYLFNKEKQEFCYLYNSKLKKINFSTINQIKIDNNLTNIKLFALLGNTNAYKEILNHYNKNTKDYVFWLMIGAENGDKTIQKEFGEFLKSDTIADEQLKVVFLTRNEKDIRGDFWIKRSQEN